MMRAARNWGATGSRRNRVLGIRRRPDGSFDVDTELGTVHAEHVVNAAGCYAHRVARMVGLDAPIASVLHTYLLTEPVPEFADLDREPVVRDDYCAAARATSSSPAPSASTWPDFTLSETGFAEQRALFDLLMQRSGTPPPSSTPTTCLTTPTA